ncbi:hypothetical protein AAFF_G00402030 [Aldrovandia affinis]|uniref:Uncharacterized protein n=1 Tax=Aldrovandia affinis TaxID=143900 RepID=A0AAD7WZN1_9TELE|nr:hypothetical protein AAFF_G00402030 [Aldrovandia affinis]
MIDGAEIHIGNSLENNGNSNPLVSSPVSQISGRGSHMAALLQSTHQSCSADNEDLHI